MFGNRLFVHPFKKFKMNVFAKLHVNRYQIGICRLVGHILNEYRIYINYIILASIL